MSKRSASQGKSVLVKLLFRPLFDSVTRWRREREKVTVFMIWSDTEWVSNFLRKCGDCADLWGNGFKMCVKNPPTGIRSLLAAISTFEVSGHACSSEAALLAKQIRSIHVIEFFLYTRENRCETSLAGIRHSSLKLKVQLILTSQWCSLLLKVEHEVRNLHLTFKLPEF